MPEYPTTPTFDSYEHAQARAQARQAAAFIEISTLLQPRMAETGDSTVLAAVHGLLADVVGADSLRKMAHAAAEGHDHARQVLTEIARVFGRVDDLDTLPALVKALDDRHRPAGEIDQLRADLQRYRDDAVKWETAAVAADRAAKQAHTHAGNMSDRLWRLQLNCGWMTTGGDLQFQVSQLEERLPGELEGFKRLIAGHEEARNLQFEQLKVAQAELQASRENLAAVRSWLDMFRNALGLDDSEDPSTALALAFSMNLPSPDWRILPTADQPPRWFAHKDGPENERVVDSMLEALKTAWWRNVDDVVRDRTADLEQRVSELKQSLATSAKKREAAAKEEEEAEQMRREQRAQLAAALEVLPVPGGTYFMNDLIAAATKLREQATSHAKQATPSFARCPVCHRKVPVSFGVFHDHLAGAVGTGRTCRHSRQPYRLSAECYPVARGDADLPQRSPAPITKQGLFGKYDVLRCDGKQDPPGSTYFVLRFNDATAPDGPEICALGAYVDAVKGTHPHLADDLISRYLRHQRPPRALYVGIEIEHPRDGAARRWRIDFEPADPTMEATLLGAWTSNSTDRALLEIGRARAWALYDAGVVNPSPTAPVEQG